jgi:5-methylcytosine-specific restriction endonuclease McrA
MADTLLLNTDAQPVSYLPLSTLTWQEAIKYMVLEKARVLEWHENWIVHSASWATPVPSVMMLTEYMKPKSTIRFSKSNVFLRDRFKCQYCSKDLEKKHCTLDHVLPLSLGGKTVWENSVTACGPCNAAKGSTTKIKPKQKPYKPEYWDLVNKHKQLSLNLRYAVWETYLGY